MPDFLASYYDDSLPGPSLRFATALAVALMLPVYGAGVLLAVGMGWV